MHEMELRIRKTIAATVSGRCFTATVPQQPFPTYNGFPSYKPAVDDLWHPLSPAHGLPRISASENIYIFIQDQGAPPSPSPQ